MIEILVADYGLFLLKVLTLVVALALAAALVVGIAARARRAVGGGAGGTRGRGGGGKGDGEGRIEVRKYNERLDALRESLTLALLDPAARRVEAKARRARDKREAKEAKRAAKLARRARGKGETVAPAETRRRVFVLDFDGDIRASQVEKLRREITAVLTSATSADEVLVRLDSGGGTVTGYGLAASQLDRVREKGVPLTVCIDKVAASGGYMMACVADRLIAAPFAVLGSIGVVAQIPNFHRLLKELNIDVELLTAGKYKRTLTLFGENTEEAREKFMRDIERIHAQFKEYVGRHRPTLDIERVSTGEVWSGQDALELHLADELGTSDEYLIAAAEEERDVLLVGYKAKKKGLMARLAAELEGAVDRLLLRWVERLARSRFP